MQVSKTGLAISRPKGFNCLIVYRDDFNEKYALDVLNLALHGGWGTQQQETRSGRF